MKKLYILLCILFLTAQQIVFSQCSDWKWAKSAVSLHGTGLADCTDAQGNVAITGYYEDSITIGSIVLADSGGHAFFVAKYDSSGNVLWAKTAHWGGTGPGQNEGRGIAIDANGNVVVTGYFTSHYITFDTIVLTGANVNFFVAKYDFSGNIIWAKSAFNSWVQGFAITTDFNNNVLITGKFASSSMNIDGTILTNAGVFPKTDVFVAKYGPLGNLLWAKSAGGNDYDNCYSISSDQDGNVLIAGDFSSDTLYFNTTPLANLGVVCSLSPTFDIFMAKYDSSGNLLWVKRAGGKCDDRCHYIKTDMFSNILITGNFNSDSITFDNITLANSNFFSNVFLAKYDSSGNVLWAKSAGGTDDDKGFCVSPDDSGNIYMTGCFNSPSINFDFITLTPPVSSCAGGCDPMFIVKYNPNGNVLCAQALASGGSSAFLDEKNAICIDHFGNSFITGHFYANPFILGSDSLPLIGYENVFVARSGMKSLYVWPGDANEDLVANNYDLLPLGLYYGSIGFSRDSISNVWTPHAATDWAGIQNNGANYKFADCNGDSIININDTLAINLNYSFSHNYRFASTQNTATAPQLHFVTLSSAYLPGSWIDVDIWVSDAANPINLYGIAFNLNYDLNLIQPGSISLLYPSSWLGTPGTNAITIGNTTNDVEGAITRIVHTNSTGYGKIATLHFQAATGITSASELHLGFSNYQAFDVTGNLITFNLSPDSILIDPALGIKNFGDNASLVIFPNPAITNILISYITSSESEISLVIYNTLGQKVKTLYNAWQNAGTHELKTDMKNFQQGIYFIKIISGNEVVIVKKILKD